jgi:N-acetyl-anhydromuramyl-L-alanine amidase AmpD
MLGFTIKTDGENKRYEVVIASDAALFRSDGKPKRAKTNFYSSRVAGLQPVAAGEAVYILPPEVLARFVGQEKLYYALATYSNGKGATPEISLSPSEASAYIDLRGLTGRSLKRVRVLPSRQSANAGYGNGVGAELDWGGDLITPGTQPAGASAPVPQQGGAKGNDGTGAGGAQAASLNYSDGFGELPSHAPTEKAAEAHGRASVHAQSAESFSLNWDEVQQVAQPTDVSCWAASAAMVIGWRDQLSLTPERVAGIAGRSTSRGLDLDDSRKFAREIGLEYEAPQCYTIDGLRALLENFGPFWVGVQLPGSGHAVVVTGMYSDGAPDGSDTFVRISDPWDRVIGRPGVPGAYLNTHNTGSRYILSWADFTSEYELLATSAPDGSVNAQILHSAGSGSRQPNHSGAVGYAMAGSAATAGGRGYPLQRGVRPRALEQDVQTVQDVQAVSDDDDHGIEEPISDTAPEIASAQSYARAQSEPPEYPQASRLAPAAPVNYRASRTQRAIERVVVHITDGGSKISGTIGWFQNPDQRNRRGEPIHVSAHYVVGQDGEVVQMVHHNDVAWHANSANKNSIGIEHVANTKGLMPTEAQYCASATLVRWLCDTYSIPVDRTHVLGHSEADTRTSHSDCPNAVWDWDHFMEQVQTASCQEAAQAQGLGLRDGTPTVNLPPPPPQVIRAKALDAGVEMASTIPGASMEKITNREGNITWELEQLRGLKHPNDKAPSPASPCRDAPTLGLHEWPYVGALNGECVAAWFVVDWQFNGKSVGNVRISGAGTKGARQQALQVEAKIMDDSALYPRENPTCAAVLVRFTYRFARANGADLVAVTDIRLYGDGTFDKSSRWEQS